VVSNNIAKTLLPRYNPPEKKAFFFLFFLFFSWVLLEIYKRSAASIILIARAMQTFIAKFVKTSERIEKPHFFVLCKGMNSGKPLNLRCPNSFCVICSSEEEKEKLYWVTFALWRSKAFHPYLSGSVIPFIHINDFKQLVQVKLEIVNNDNGAFTEVVKNLKLIEQSEKHFLENLKLVQELKQAYIYKYFNKTG
jgi:hypothetical protein